MKSLYTLALTVLLACSALAADLSVDDIVTKANHAAYYGGKDGRATVLMEIHRGDVKDIRKFVILRLDVEDGGDQKFYVYFHEPSNLHGMSYLVHKYVKEGRGDDRWLFQPALRRTSRIAPGDKRTSFANSDFFYEDVSGRNLSEDKHELTDTTDKHYVVKNTPLRPDEVEFSYYTVWIDKKTFLPVKAEYYDKNGKKYRLVEALEVETVQDIPTVMKSKVTDLRTDNYTVNTFSKVEYDVGLREPYFTKRYLSRMPRPARY